VALSVLVAGCGASPPAVVSANQPQAPAAVTTTSSKPAPRSGQVSLTLSGTVAGPFTTDSMPCVVITDQGPPALTATANGSVDGAPYNITLNVRNLTVPQPFAMVEDKGGGNYLELSTGDGNTIWQSVAGTLTWDNAHRSMTVAVDLGSGGTDAAPKKPVHLAGSVVCGG
jgi:hypothetical protein